YHSAAGCPPALLVRVGGGGCGSTRLRQLGLAIETEDQQARLSRGVRAVIDSGALRTARAAHQRDILLAIGPKSDRWAHAIAESGRNIEKHFAFVSRVGDQAAVGSDLKQKIARGRKSAAVAAVADGDSPADFLLHRVVSDQRAHVAALKWL